MSGLLLAAAKAPHIDWAAFSPFIALAGGAILVTMAGLLRGRVIRESGTAILALITLAVTLGLVIWQWDARTSLIRGAIALDKLTVVLSILFVTAGAVTVILAWRSRAASEAGHGEFHGLVLFALFGMLVLVAAQNLVTIFLGYELLSIPLYVLCATETRRASSLEAGLKYLIVGSVGSATLLYGLAFVYGATGTTDLGGIAKALDGTSVVTDPLLLTGIGLATVGLAFKASVAPFHQWTPDVYEGAPTPVTAFMAVATKAAAFGIFLRLFVTAFSGAAGAWSDWLAVLATVTIVVGNVGALGQSSVKRLLAWSSVAQAGYMLGGVVVGTQLGVKATVFYLAVYLVMNVAAFAVVIARERVSVHGDGIDAFAGLGAEQPLLAWPMTLAMLSLAGIPATAGFIGKIYLIEALADGWMWLAIVLVVGSMISLAYYLRVVAVMWMRSSADTPARPVMAGADPAADAEPAPKAGWEVTAVAVIAGVAIVVLGVIPGPLFHLVGQTVSSFPGVF
jgi:NADH-quinone oxidoreductase subunit N